MATSFIRLWGWPIAMGLLICSGLASALVSDLWGDIWSWIGLGVPVLVMTWFALRPSTPNTVGSFVPAMARFAFRRSAPHNAQ